MKRKHDKGGRKTIYDTACGESDHQGIRAGERCLFLERYNRKVVPTESGRLLYQYACHILGLYQDLEQHLKETEGVRTIRIGANLSVGVKMLRGFIRAFEKSIQISK